MVFWILLFPNSHKNSKETLNHFWGHKRVPFICSNGMKFISDIMQIGGHEWWATQPMVALLHKKKLEVQVGGRTLSSAGGFWGLWGTNVCVNGHSSHRARLLPSLLNYWSSHLIEMAIPRQKSKAPLLGSSWGQMCQWEKGNPAPASWLPQQRRKRILPNWRELTGITAFGLEFPTQADGPPIWESL